VTIESGVGPAAVRLSLVVEQRLGFKPPQLGSGRHCADRLIPPVRRNLVCKGCGAGRRGRGWCSRGAFGQRCGENSRPQVVVVVNPGGCLARLGRKLRPAYWTRRPLNAIGAARNRVSRAGQSKCPGVVVFRTNGRDAIISAGAPSPARMPTTGCSAR